MRGFLLSVAAVRNWANKKRKENWIQYRIAAGLNLLAFD